MTAQHGGNMELLKRTVTWRLGRSLLTWLGVVSVTLGCAADHKPLDVETQTSEGISSGSDDSDAEVGDPGDFDSLLDTFTTIGKPTKIVDAPWGTREVYDPLQDEALQKIFQRYIFLIRSDDDSTEDERKKLYNAISNAERANWNDFTRQGCGSMIDNLCLDWDKNPQVSNIDCRQDNVMGSPNLSECMLANQPNYPLPEYGQVYTTCDYNENPNMKFDFSYLQKNKSLDTTDAFNLYFKRDCRSWANHKKYFYYPNK